jgi:thymidylate kinase
VILIDGPDGAGKTTLSEMLIREKVTNMNLVSPKRAHPNMHLAHSTKDYLQRYSHNNRVSVDRFIFSELVYGPILRGGCCFTHLESSQMIADLFQSQSVVIFCLPDVNSLIFKKDESTEVIGKIRDIYQEYLAWSLVCRSLSRTPGRVLRYQWNLPEAFDGLVRQLRRFS